MNSASIFTVHTTSDFEKLALAVFKYQAENNAVYQSFLKYLNCNYTAISNIEKIPFLPIQFFKTHQILSDNNPAKEVFLSSGTTGSNQSKHFVTDLSLYKKSYVKGFNHFYGAVTNYTILALLPSYLNRKSSSLIYMVADLIKRSNKPNSGFYLNNL